MGSQFSNLQNLASSDWEMHADESSQNFSIYSNSSNSRSSRRRRQIEVKIRQIPPKFGRRKMRPFVAAESLRRFEDSRAKFTLMNLIPNRFSPPLYERILDPLGMAGLVTPQSLRRFENLVAFLVSVDFALARIVWGRTPPHISRQHNQAQRDIAFLHFQLLRRRRRLLGYFFFVIEIDSSRALESRGGIGEERGGFAGEGEDGVVGPHVSAEGFAVGESLEAELAIHRRSFRKSEIGNAFCMYVSSEGSAFMPQSCRYFSSLLSLSL